MDHGAAPVTVIHIGAAPGGAGSAIRAVALLAHEPSAVALEAMEQAAALARAAGVAVTRFHDTAARPAWPTSRDLAGIDLIVTFGGDGSVLHALRAAVGTRVPVLAVNFGQLGFLASVSPQHLDDALRAAFHGDLTTVVVPTLSVQTPGAQTRLAVNDGVIVAERRGHSVLLNTWIDGVEFGRVRCDGIIVATPVGSTAYNLSAGGPVLGWGTNALAVTFVSAHTLSARSFVLPRGHVLEVENASRTSLVRLLIDGAEELEPYPPGDRVRLTYGRARTRVALLPGVSMVRRLRDTFAPLAEPPADG